MDQVFRDEIGESDTYSVFDFSEKCLTGATLEISEQLKKRLKNDEKFRNLTAKLTEMKRLSFAARDYSGAPYFEIEIVGEISESEKIGHYSVPFAIKVNDLKPVSEIIILSREEILKMRESRGEN